MVKYNLITDDSVEPGRCGAHLVKRRDWEAVYQVHYGLEDEVHEEENGVEGDKWNLGLSFTRRLNKLRKEAKHLQYMFAVTSTLGGANHLCNRPVQALLMAKKQEEVGLRLHASSIVIRSRVFQAVNYALMEDLKTANSLFRSAYRKAKEHNDEGIINFTKAVHGWLAKELAALALSSPQTSPRS